MKKIVYSITGFSFSLAAALGIAVSLLGIFFVWRMVPSVSEQLVATVSFAQQALDTTEVLLGVADSTLTQAGDSVALIADATKEVADTLGQTSSIASSAASSVGNEFIGVVEKTQTALTALETSAKLVDDTLSFIASIPFLGTKYSNKTPLYSSVVGINEGLVDLPETLKEMEENLSSTAKAFTTLNESVTVLAENVDEIEANIMEANEVVGEYQMLVNEAQESAANMIVKLPRWVRWAAVGLTLLFVWLIVIQAGLLMFGMEMAGLRKQTPVEQPAPEEPQPAPELAAAPAPEPEPEAEPAEISAPVEDAAQQEEPPKEKKKKKKSK